MKKVTLILPVILVLITGCKKEEGTVLAKVGRSTLTLEKFNSVLPVEYQATLAREDKINLVDNWINTELVYVNAVKEGVLKNPDIADQIEQFKKQIVINYWLNQTTFSKFSVSDIEIKDYYEANKEIFDKEIKVAQIVVATRKDALELKRRLDEGADFSKLAREYSIDPSASNDGVIGYIKLGDVALTGFDEAAFSLKEIGDVSDVIQTENGFHIIKLLGKRTLREPPKFEDLKDAIKKQLIVDKQIAAVDSIVEKLRKETPVEVHYELLD